MDRQGTWRKANVFSVPGGQIAREKQKEEGKARLWGGVYGFHEQEKSLAFIHCTMGRLLERFMGWGQEDEDFVFGESI